MHPILLLTAGRLGWIPEVIFFDRPRQRLRQAGELNKDSDPDTAGSKFERENRLRNRAGGPKAI